MNDTTLDDNLEDTEQDEAFADSDDVADSSELGEMESYVCAFCGELNELFVDRTVSRHQQFTEDCDVCCRPNLVTVQIDIDGSVWIDAEQEDEA